jgi:sporulation protein YlmC with PRC-barrel domain
MLNRENNTSTNTAALTSPHGHMGTDVVGFEDRKLTYASKILGAFVRNSAGHNVGHIDDIAVDPTTGDIAHAVLSLGGFLGIGEHIHPVPWSVLKFDAGTNSYTIPVSDGELRTAPTYSKSAFYELRDNDESFPHNIFAYYGIYT